MELKNEEKIIEKIEVKNFKQTKVRDKLINRISKAKDIRNFIKAQLEIIKKDKIEMSNSELILFLEEILKKYDEFQLKASVNLKSWKGDSELIIQRYPNYFLVREPRKKELEDGSYSIDWITHNIPLESVLKVIKALNCLKLNIRIKTRKFAQIYCVENEITRNEEDRPLFDKDGFNFSNFSGNRPLYFSFYYPIKIAQHYGIIQYYKNGSIRKIKDKFDVQTEFT